MSSSSSWGNEAKTIIYRKMGSIWTWDEYLDSCTQERQMAEDVQNSITLIIDVSQSLALPTGSLVHFKHTLEDCCEQCEKQILVSKHQAYRTLHRLLIQMMPEAKDHFFIVRSIAEAYQLAEQSIQKPITP